MMRTTLTKGLTTGATMAAATAATMMVASSLRLGSPWAGLNAMAGAVGAGGRRPRACFDARVTPIGLAVLAGGLLAWGMAYEGALSAGHRRSDLTTGAISGALGYAIDKVAL